MKGRDEEKKPKDNPISASFVKGAIALVFLIIGYEAALFVQKAAVSKVVANRDAPDTVYVVRPAHQPAEKEAVRQAHQPVVRQAHQPEEVIARKLAEHSAKAKALTETPAMRRKVESFRFDPNTVSIEDLQRLGFSEKQAISIDNYRLKGGRFRRKEDFAKSFVVADSVYQRLAPYIDIPKIDINSADSTLLVSLPGIGAYFASKIIEYRERLGGYSYKEQLLDIYHFDRDKLNQIGDLIKVGPNKPFPLWTASEEELKSHPYIGSYRAARSIILYRENHSPEECTVDGLIKAGILSQDSGEKLSRCRIEKP